MSKFKKGDLARNVHTMKTSKVVDVEVIEDYRRTFEVTVLGNGDRFNQDYNEHYELESR